MPTVYVLLLFLISICPSDTSARINTDIYVAITWDMPWSEFCYLGSLFKDKLSNELLEIKGALVYRVQSGRIRYMNFDKECQYKQNDESALLELYVSKSTELPHPDADKNMTYRAYNILYDYWRNKKMILLDKVFQGKVDEVALMGKEKPQTTRTMSDAERVGIGIAIGLAIVFLITGIYLIVAWKRKVKEPVHGVELNIIPTQPAVTRVDNRPRGDWWPKETGHWNSSDTGSVMHNAGYHDQDEPLDSTML